MTDSIQKSAARIPLPGYRLALAATLVAVLVVVLGAFTRLVDAGLGCPDWPGCYGQLVWPDTPEEIARAEAAFPDSPVDNDKTWPEMVHRYFASFLGLLIIGLVVIAVRQRKSAEASSRRYPIKLPLLLLFLVIWQGLFGMWTVTLKLWPQVVTLHLLGGFTVLSLLWVLTLRLRNRPWRPCPTIHRGLQRFMPWVVVGIVVVTLQVALGGWVSSNYAALACPDLPTCQGQWLPPLDAANGFNVMQAIGPNYLGGLLDNDARVTIHFSHRIGAIVVTFYLLSFVAALWAAGSGAKKSAASNSQIAIRGLRRFAVVIAAALLLQIALGISNVLFFLPLPVAVAHNAGGALLLLTLVTLATKIKTAAVNGNTASGGAEGNQL